MDRVQFLQEIHHNDENNISIIRDFFEQYMLLYDLTEKNVYNATVVSLNNDNGEFRIDFKTENDMNRVINNFEPSMIAYRKMFSISFNKISDLSIVLYIRYMML